MKCIVILATICKETGALTIYKQLMKHIAEMPAVGIHYYVFIDPTMPMPIIDGVDYIKYNTTGFRRFCFDSYVFKRICRLKGIYPDVIFSLNNSGVRYKGVRQIIYYHQALPLYSNCFSPFKAAERTLWLFHYYYPLYVKMSLKRNTSVVVQTEIIKNLFTKKYKFPVERIYTAFPDIEKISTNIIVGNKYDDKTYNFLYPATSFKYKNHIALAQILTLIKTPKVKNRIRVHLTLKLGDNIELEQKIRKEGLQNQFVFHGAIPHDRLLSMYKNADALLFPSTIETIGLPLLEAASFGLPIITNDLEYARKVLMGYEGHITVPLQDFQTWADSIENICIRKPRYQEYERLDGNDWNKVINLIINNKFE